LDTPYACYGRKVQCTRTEAECHAGSSFYASTLVAAQRRLLQVDPSAPLAGQEACVNCQNAVVAMRQDVVLSRDRDTQIDVSVDAAGVPRTQLLVPAGAILTKGDQPLSLRVEPVPASTLSFPRSPPSDQSSLPAGPFLFSTNVLSTPFKLSVLSGSGAASSSAASIQGRVVVTAAVDNIVYDPFQPAGDPTGPPQVPCELQGATYAVRADASVYVNTDEETGVNTPTPYASCGGSFTVGATTMKLALNPACDSLDVTGEYVGQGGSVISAWDGLTSSSCICFNVTSSAKGRNPLPLPPYPPRNTSVPWSRFDVGQTVCMYAQRTVNEFHLAFYTDPLQASLVCPFRGKERYALFYTMSRTDQRDACGGGSGRPAGNYVMNPVDICLATVDPAIGTWSCLAPALEDRLANPSWTSASGRKQNRVQATLSHTNYPVLAFAYIPLPQAAEPSPPECDLLCQYKEVIIGVVIGTLSFCVCSAYVIWRLQRYRVKYLENKAALVVLQERARELDETHGGLGIADDEVDMCANPIVIQMSELSKQLEEVNVRLDTRAERDEQVMERLEAERIRIHEEMERMAALMNSMQEAKPKGPRRIEAPAPSYIEAGQRAVPATSSPAARVRNASILPADAIASDGERAAAAGGFDSEPGAMAAPFAPAMSDQDDTEQQRTQHFAPLRPRKKKGTDDE